jgi:hypothetical protein
MITRKQFEKMELDMTYNEWKACYCNECSRKDDCVYYHSHKRFPESAGGRALCPNLDKPLSEIPFNDRVHSLELKGVSFEAAVAVALEFDKSRT